ncbi:MAG: histidine phosphatase family protein [Acidimicrobiales bacterium]
MELILIRHALPVRMEVTEGTADPHLDERGHAQARHLAEYLAGEHVDALYSSPMLRARQTAQHVADRLGLDVVVEDDIAENDRAGSSYVPAEELKAAGDPRWREGSSASNWSPEHEPFEVFHQRVMDGIERIVAAHPGQRVAVVCHGGVIMRYTSVILERPFDELGFFLPLYTSISRIAAARSGHRSILSLNEASHLRGTGLPTGSLH